MGERIFGWEAVARDGRLFASAMLGNGNRGGYDALPHRELALFRVTMLYHVPQPGEGRIILNLRKSNLLTVHLEEGDQLIYRRRREMLQALGGIADMNAARTCILVGTQSLVKGRPVQRLTWIFEDTGEMHTTSRFYEGILDARSERSWFYGVDLLECERT